MDVALIQKFAIDNWPLIAVAFASGAMLVWPLVANSRGGARLSTLQATQMINQKDAVVIDVRDQADFARGHIVNARSFPAKVLAERKADLEKIKAPIIVSCDTGMSAGASAEKLRGLGLTEVFILRGGISAWRDAGLPVTK